MSPASEATPETQHLITPSYSSADHDGNDIVKDLVLWRRKKLSISILVAATATATWVLMEVYQFKFLTLISWLAISLVTSIFLYANMLNILGKEPPNFSKLELREETSMRMGNTGRARIEEAIRWLFFVSTKEDWPVFVGVLAGLFALTYIGSCMDFLTFIYIGILVSTTLPMTYVKNEDKIKRLVEWLKAKYKKSYEVVDEKAIKKIKSKIMNRNEKEKKIE